MYIMDSENWVCEDCGYSFLESELSNDMIFGGVITVVYLNTQKDFTTENYMDLY